jgi:hypothetical protein
VSEFDNLILNTEQLRSRAQGVYASLMLVSDHGEPLSSPGGSSHGKRVTVCACAPIASISHFG